MAEDTQDTKKWLNEQRSLKDELKDLLTDMDELSLDDDMDFGQKPAGNGKVADDPYADRSDEDIIFEKNLHKLTGGKEGIPPEEADRILEMRRAAKRESLSKDKPEAPVEDKPASEEGEEVKDPVGSDAPSDLSGGDTQGEPVDDSGPDPAELLGEKPPKKEEPKEEPKKEEPKKDKGKDDTREIPKPKGLNKSVAAVLGHKKKKGKDKKKESEDGEEVRELPKPKGLSKSIDSVLGNKKKKSKDEALKALREKMAARDGISTPAGKEKKEEPKEEPKKEEPKKDKKKEKRSEGLTTEEVEEMIASTEKRIEKAPGNIDLTKPKELLELSKKALKEGKNDDAMKFARDSKAKISEIRSEFITARDTLKTSKEKLIEARGKGIDIKKAKSLYQQSVKMLKSSNYSMAIQYAKLCLRELERNEILSK